LPIQNYVSLQRDTSQIEQPAVNRCYSYRQNDCKAWTWCSPTTGGNFTGYA